MRRLPRSSRKRLGRAPRDGWLLRRQSPPEERRDIFRPNNGGRVRPMGRQELCLVCAVVIAAIATVLVLAGGTRTAAFGGSVKADDAARAAAWARPGEVVVSAPEIGHSSVDLDEILLQPILLQAPPRIAPPAIASADPQPFEVLSRVRGLRPAVIRVLAPPLVPFRLDESLAPGELPGPPKLQPPPVRAPRAGYCHPDFWPLRALLILSSQLRHRCVGPHQPTYATSELSRGVHA